MFKPSDPAGPIHPLTTALFLGVLYVSLIASAAASYGARTGIIVGFLLPIMALVAFGTYEMLTMPADDPRWDDIAELNEYDDLIERRF